MNLRPSMPISCQQKIRSACFYSLRRHPMSLTREEVPPVQSHEERCAVSRHCPSKKARDLRKQHWLTELWGHVLLAPPRSRPRSRPSSPPNANCSKGSGVSRDYPQNRQMYHCKTDNSPLWTHLAAQRVPQRMPAQGDVGPVASVDNLPAPC